MVSKWHSPRSRSVTSCCKDTGQQLRRHSRLIRGMGLHMEHDHRLVGIVPKSRFKPAAPTSASSLVRLPPMRALRYCSRNRGRLCS